MHQWEFLLLVGYVAGIMTPNVVKNMFKASISAAKHQAITEQKQSEDPPAKVLRLEGEKLKIS